MLIVGVTTLSYVPAVIRRTVYRPGGAHTPTSGAAKASTMPGKHDANEGAPAYTPHEGTRPGGDGKLTLRVLYS